MGEFNQALKPSSRSFGISKMARTRNGMATHPITAVVVLMLSAKTLAMPAQQIGYNLTGLGPLNTTASPGVKWAYATGNVVRSSPALSPDGSVVYVGSEDNNLHAVNTADGSKKWAYATGDAVRSSPILSPDDSVVYVGSYDHNLHAVNTTDGSSKWAFGTDDAVRSSPILSPDGSVVY